jgi:hypothetical protein
MFGSFGSTTTTPIEYDFSLSKIGDQVVPAFVVFQRPPEAVPTYHVVLLRGSTAMSLMRPVKNAGPIERKRIAEAGLERFEESDSEDALAPRAAPVREPPRCATSTPGDASSASRPSETRASSDWRERAWRVVRLGRG